MLDGTYYFECSCGSSEHSIRFTLDLDEDDDFPMIIGDIYLKHYIPFYKRIWIALKYIFKLPPQNSHFDDWIMREEDVEKLKSMCEKFISHQKTKANLTNHN